MKRQTAIIWVCVFVLIAGAVGGRFAWWRQQDVTQAYEAGQALADSQKWEEALALAQPYAGRDDPRINGLLADAYINGPDSIQDIDKGLILRRRAAEAGDMRAAYFMGRWILKHEPTEAQAKEAVVFLQEAADCGMPMANYLMGALYSKGEYVKRNYPLSIRYSERAAFAGVYKAASNAAIAYGRYYQETNPAAEEREKAMLYWIFIASKNGLTDAKDVLDEFLKEVNENEQGEILKMFKDLERESIEFSKRIKNLDGLSCSKLGS